METNSTTDDDSVVVASKLHSDTHTRQSSQNEEHSLQSINQSITYQRHTLEGKVVALRVLAQELEQRSRNVRDESALGLAQQLEVLENVGRGAKRSLLALGVRGKTRVAVDAASKELAHLRDVDFLVQVRESQESMAAGRESGRASELLVELASKIPPCC